MSAELGRSKGPSTVVHGGRAGSGWWLVSRMLLTGFTVIAVDSQRRLWNLGEVTPLEWLPFSIAIVGFIVLVWTGWRTVYPGRREALITPELSEQVQQVIDTRMRRTQRDVIHNHFLRSLMHCARCHAAGRRSQLVYSQPVNRAGQPYEYYHCRHRQQPDCGLPHLRVVDVEAAMQRELASIRLSYEEATVLREHTASHLERRLEVERDIHTRLRKELANLELKEQRLLDLVADASISTDSLRKRLRDLQVKKVTLEHKLTRTDEHVRRETDTMLAYIALLEYPG